ncbi:hypothetical protein FIBSPDRAFT_926151 [Athelia psychrophila]|uniref:Ricin B lectin domain-containing protein n=1 Tax=Athelia psychrophila TaxID=1759441 RepID=A0A166TXN8_9AGAM|nr:hypothetical protein FIBSPDRAFT_926151 [Fibularhizoctonia sp. CBS 109695]
MSDITDGIVVTLVNVHFKDRYVDLHNGDSTGIIQGYKGNGSVAQKWSFQSQGGDKYKAKSSVQNTFAYVPGGVQVCSPDSAGASQYLTDQYTARRGP